MKIIIADHPIGSSETCQGVVGDWVLVSQRICFHSFSLSSSTNQVRRSRTWVTSIKSPAAHSLGDNLLYLSAIVCAMRFAPTSSILPIDAYLHCDVSPQHLSAKRFESRRVQDLAICIVSGQYQDNGVRL